MKKNTLKSNDKKQDVKLTKTILSTIGGTIMVLLFVVGFLFITTSVIAPNAVTPLLTSIGSNNANYLLYKRMYEREKTNQNLYNVIQLAIENEKYDDQAIFIAEMINGDDFEDFSKKVDEQTKEALGKRYSVYADSYESYLRRHIVVALYKTGNELEAKMMAIDSVYGKADELYTYVMLVSQDENLIESQKEAEFNTFYQRYGLVDALKLKIEELDVNLNSTETSYDKVVLIEQKIKLAEVQHYIGKYTKKVELENDAKQNIEKWQLEIKNLLDIM